MKRKRKPHATQRASKRQKLTPNSSSSSSSSLSSSSLPLLQQFYPHVLSLRQYLAARCTRNQRRRLLQYGHVRAAGTAVSSNSEESRVAALLDQTLIGTFARVAISEDASGQLERDVRVFTQQVGEHSSLLASESGEGTIVGSGGPGKQSEIVDFAIWLLFRRHVGPHKPSHLLCQGFQRSATSIGDEELCAVPGIPGLFSSSTNRHVQSLKSEPWTALPALLGRRSERILSDMLVQCGIFSPVGVGCGNLYQISGTPLSDLKPLRPTQERQDHLRSDGKVCVLPLAVKCSSPRGLSAIRLVRHRMLYARPFVSSQGRICLGFNQNHILTILKIPEDKEQTTTVMKYIFPRQFGLHNVFTSDVDRQDTAQPFKDYTTRETEIARKILRWKQERVDQGTWTPDKVPPLPKRLRGKVLQLVHRLRKRHTRCPFHALLQHYCPASSDCIDGGTKTFSLASKPAQVAAFCRVAVFQILPPEFMGNGEIGIQNKSVLSRSIDKFLQLRRYESLSMHDVMQNMAISDVEWLAPTKGDGGDKLSNTDFTKRQELMAELLYYIFDSLIIPLIRSNFHVTESGAHKNQLFYFRHDVWEAMSKPALSSLKHNMLEQCKATEVKKLLSKRALGVSRVRLLPKEQGMRPIINLRRRVQRLQQGRLVLGRSINSLLNPAFAVLNHEKGSRPELLGSALFSVDDMFPRLQAFKGRLSAKALLGSPLYFAKVDVKACFDTIPQKRLMGLVRTIIADDQYMIARYARAKLLGGTSEATPGFGAKPSWRYLTKATAGGQPFEFLQEIELDTAEGRNRTVYVDNVVQRLEVRSGIIKLLEEHVESNLIQLGKHYYRQKEGIPQGSIVSSLLCSYIYAELEREVLCFLDHDQSMLLRLIDDFLVITTDRQVAERFMQIMHGGLPQYGVQVKAEKSRANFDVSIDQQKITRMVDECDFSYCGHAINTKTLDVSKDCERRRKTNMADSVTVEYSRLPGQSFYRKTLSALKLQMHPMLLSTNYNATDTVFINLYHAFSEVALKSYYYVRSLAGGKRPSDGLIIKTVNDSIKLACVLMRHRPRTKTEVVSYACAVTNAQTRWLASTAFHTVFARRQTRHRALLQWVQGQLEMPASRAQRNLLEPVANRYRRAMKLGDVKYSR